MYHSPSSEHALRTTSVTGESTQTIAPPVPYPDADLINVMGLLSADEGERLRELREIFQSEIRPVVGPYWDRAEFPFELLPKLAALQLVGGASGHGSHLLTGLIEMELTRADTSIGTFFGVHNELFVAALQLLGSAEQRERLLPDLLALRTIGAFALTEPAHGSDISRRMESSARRIGDEWVLNGTKRWIGNGTIADFLLVWARDESDRQIKGFIVEADRPGVTATKIENKTSLRIVQNADIVLDQVRVPHANLLPGAASFRDTNELLRNSRVWVAWQAVGQQFAAFDVARAWALSREQFGAPLAGRQLIQEQLSRMIGNATMSLSLMIQLARLQETGEITMEHAAMAKATCTTRMRETVQLGRSMLGGNGISTEYEMAKIFADAESIYSYEGTYEINALIVGRAVTGISAIA